MQLPQKPILKGGVRILRPAEYDLLREGAKTLENQTRLDVLLLTGLRYIEAQRLQGNPDWLDSKFIHPSRVRPEEGEEKTEGALGQALQQRNDCPAILLQCKSVADLWGVDGEPGEMGETSGTEPGGDVTEDHAQDVGELNGDVISREGPRSFSEPGAFGDDFAYSLP